MQVYVGQRAAIVVNGEIVECEIARITKMGTRAYVACPFYYSSHGVYQKGRSDTLWRWVDVNDLIH